jgi:hypothetical protein
MATISHASKRFVVAYILLVGLPLLGLVGVLKVGHSVSAPVSIDGAWKLDVDNPVSGPCGKALASLPTSAFNISQSGKNLVLNLNSRPAGSATIDGNRFNGVLELSDVPVDDQACPNHSTLHLLASVDAKTEPRVMTGTISVNGCARCATMNYQAVRQDSAAKRGTR